MKIKNVKQIETSSCSSVFEVDGITLRLWIIVGGEPCLSFEDYSFSERYPITDKRWSEQWKKEDGPSMDGAYKGRYPHQIGQNPIQGPTFDVLPEGIKSVEEFLKKYLPLKQLRRDRFLLLPITGELYSKGFRDKDNQTIVKFEIDVRENHICPITAVSRAYCGRCEESIKKFAPPEFKRYAAFVNPFFDKTFENGSLFALNCLTEDQFTEFQSIMGDIKKYVEKMK